MISTARASPSPDFSQPPMCPTMLPVQDEALLPRQQDDENMPHRRSPAQYADANDQHRSSSWHPHTEAQYGTSTTARSTQSMPGAHHSCHRDYGNDADVAYNHRFENFDCTTAPEAAFQQRYTHSGREKYGDRAKVTFGSVFTCSVVGNSFQQHVSHGNAGPMPYPTGPQRMQPSNPPLRPPQPASNDAADLNRSQIGHKWHKPRRS